MNTYPATLYVERPQRFDRVQLALRIVALLVLSGVGLSLGAFVGFLYMMLPLLAAVLISQGGPGRFLEEDAPRISRAIGWVLSIYAYFALLTDRLPIKGSEPAVQYSVVPTGVPTVGSALVRLLLTVPAALLLALLGCVSWFIWIVAAAMILITGSYPDGLHDFQCGVLRWLARMLAYHGSLVEEYPPLAFDPGPAAAPGRA